MSKPVFALALLIACIPPAFAFPPCPQQPVQLLPVESEANHDRAAWFHARYALVGNALADTAQDDEDVESSTNPGTGVCRGVAELPVPESNVSLGNLQLAPTYAPNGSFGIVALPELPFVAVDGLNLQYRLQFDVENASLAGQDDWFDIVELDFTPSGTANATLPRPLSSVYRVRKTQVGAELTRIEVIESRVPPSGIDSKPTPVDHVVATIPLQKHAATTTIALRWTQHAVALPSGGNDTGIVTYNIDSVLEVLAPDQSVLYAATLPSQWANTFAMGMLDYNVVSTSEYEKNFRLRMDGMSLSATTF